MTNVFLAPRSNETSHTNFQSTITVGRKYMEIEPFLNLQEKSVLSKYPNLSIWGNKESLRSRWAKMRPGDWVLFYARGFFTYSARVVLTKYDSELGKKLWPVDEDGEPWPCLFFVDSLKELQIPIRTLQELAEYETGWDRVQGFMPLKPEGVRAIAEKFGSIEIFLNQTPATYQAIENMIEEENEEILKEEKRNEIDKKNLLEIAGHFQNAIASHVLSTSPRKVRVENRNQKKRIAQLEDYSCQVCNWAVEWTNSKGGRSYRIDIDHIVDKSKGGGEEVSNLWALCPNCHIKKTVGVLKINPRTKKITEKGVEIKLHHDNHLGW